MCPQSVAATELLVRLRALKGHPCKAILASLRSQGPQNRARPGGRWKSQHPSSP